MRLKLATVCLVTLLVAPVGCAHWVPLGNHVTQTAVDPAGAYAAVLKVAGERQYTVVEQRDAERYVRLRAHVDEKRSDHPSFIAAQVDATGRVALTPSGFLVHGDKVHGRLASEVTYFEDALRGELKHSPAQASAPAAVPPPPAPGSEPAPAPPVTAAAVSLPTPPPPAQTAKPASSSKPKAAPKPKPASGDDWEPVK